VLYYSRNARFVLSLSASTLCTNYNSQLLNVWLIAELQCCHEAPHTYWLSYLSPCFYVCLKHIRRRVFLSIQSSVLFVSIKSKSFSLLHISLPPFVAMRIWPKLKQFDSLVLWRRSQHQTVICELNIPWYWLITKWPAQQNTTVCAKTVRTRAWLSTTWDFTSLRCSLSLSSGIRGYSSTAYGGLVKHLALKNLLTTFWTTLCHW